MKIPRILLSIFAVLLCLIFLANLFPGSAVFNLLTIDPEEAVGIAEDDLEEIAIGLGRYHTTTGTFPSTEQGMEALATRPTTPPVPKNWTRKLERIPLDPWDHPYLYEYNPDADPGERIDLYSLGPDGIESDDDIKSEIAF